VVGPAHVARVGDAALGQHVHEGLALVLILHAAPATSTLSAWTPHTFRSAVCMACCSPEESGLRRTPCQAMRVQQRITLQGIACCSPEEADLQTAPCQEPCEIRTAAGHVCLKLS
jgi:hypothetical protein